MFCYHNSMVVDKIFMQVLPHLSMLFRQNLLQFLGLRVEQINQTLNFNTSLTSGFNELDQTEVLPSASFKYELK